MFGKRSQLIIIAAVMTLATVPPMYAQSIPYPEMPKTYQDTIKLFPANLQSGFFGLYTTLSYTGSEGTALDLIHMYYRVHWLKENYIIKGRGSEVMDNGRTVMEAYTQGRAGLLAQIPITRMMASFLGNPGGTNWDVWQQRLMEWM